MVIGRWVLIGAFFGLVVGALVGAGDLLLHYHYPYDPHYDKYPFPIALGLVVGGDAFVGLCPGAVYGYFTGVRIRTQQEHRNHEISQQSVGNPEVWPPPPTLSEVKDVD